ncbi:MAG: transaldolase, partial [Planctomycetes bacterium]|nr:transaldolase [Planctomycetota bacterium]
NPGSEEDAAWALMRQIAIDCAQVLEPIWKASGGRQGLLSVQVDPRRHGDAEFMIEQAMEISGVAPNLSIKIPTTEAGLTAIEELAAGGINTTATVSFTVPQVIASAEAFRRGRDRAEAKGDHPVQCFPVVMVGRLDDHLRQVAEEQGIGIDEDVFTKAGVAVVKKAYRIFEERNYAARLLIGAMRGAYHITEFIGGDIVLTASPKFHDVFEGSEGVLTPRLDEPVDPAAIDELSEKLPDFRRAYEEDGMAPAEFADFGSSAKTLDQFVNAFNDILNFVGEIGN